MSLLQVAEWLEASAAGYIARESLWGFTILVAIHLVGLAVSVGIVIWLDLRLLGLNMQAQPVSVVYRRLMPIAFAGFAVMFITGGLLLAGFATAAYGNLYFRIKVAAMLLAGVNALLYHRLTERSIARWNEAARPPLPARAAGLISIAAWTVVVLCGRMMSYTMF
jgi:hypothetical protein